MASRSSRSTSSQKSRSSQGTPQGTTTLSPKGSKKGKSGNGSMPPGASAPLPVKAVSPIAAEEKALGERDESRFWLAATLVLIAGIALRQWNLEAFPYHPDEAIHAWYADDFKNYHYDPIYHGPLLYHLLAAVMSIAGSNDYTARLVPSLLGIGILALVIGPARKFLGPRGALWSLALLAISPVIVTYSRRVLHDSLAMLLTLAAVLCFQTTREQPSGTRSGALARIGVLVALTLFLCTKANVFFIIAMLIAFWIAERIADYWTFEPFAEWRYVPVVAFALLALASHFTYRADELTNATLKFSLTETAFKFVCVVSCGAVGLWILSGPIPGLPAEGATESGDLPAKRAFSPIPYIVGIFLSLLLFVFLYGEGWRWFLSQSPVMGATGGTATGHISVWESISKALAPGNLHTTEVVPAEDGAITKMLKYWGGQQDHPRLPGPHDYYLVLLALYELPIFLAAMAGLWRACRERTPFTDLLVWWNVTSFALYSLANEKVPWLMAHLILPMALLGGWWLSRAFDDVAHRRVAPAMRAALAGGVALGAIYLLRGVSACNFERGADQHEPMFYAQDTEMFRDVFFGAMKNTSAMPQSGIWVDNGENKGKGSLASAMWPCAWYVREGAAILHGSPVYWGNAPGGPMRVAVTSPERWATMSTQPQYRNWQSQKVEFYIWPRANFPALRPDNWSKFWWRRIVNPGNSPDGLLAPPGEWSNNYVVIATPPGSKAKP